MKRALIFLTVGLMMTGCGGTRYIPVKSTETVRDTVILKPDTVRVEIPRERVVEAVPQLDTLNMETSVASAQAFLDTLTRTLRGTLKNKPVELKKETQAIERVKTVERKVEVPVEVVKTKYRIPRWAWISLMVNLVMVGLGLFRLWH